MTFCSALVRRSRLKFWKTKPIFEFRTSARCSADMAEISCPSSQYWPEVGRSRQPRMFISVLLPEPLTPTSAINSPRSIFSVTPLQNGNFQFAAVIDFIDVLQPDEFHIGKISERQRCANSAFDDRGQERILGAGLRARGQSHR